MHVLGGKASKMNNLSFQLMKLKEKERKIKPNICLSKNKSGNQRNRNSREISMEAIVRALKGLIKVIKL